MKKRILSFIIIASTLLTFAGCMDVEPVSSITDANMWKNEGHYKAFVTGVHTRLRNNMFSLFCLGEIRSDIYSTQPSSWADESNKAIYMTTNALSEINYGIGNYAEIYSTVNQINLFISKAESTDILKPADKNYYLGEMYGLRAYLYFHLLRSWGDVIWNDQPSTGFEVGKLEKATTPAAEIMKNIKSDIQSSEDLFGSDYSFKETKSFWSKAATLMLKAEVYLWSSKQMNGGKDDARTAKTALMDIQNNVPTLKLLPNFKEVFDYKKKGNDEIIFAIRYKYQEQTLFDGKWRNNMVPQLSILTNFYDENGAKFDKTKDNFNGTNYYPLQENLIEIFGDKDTRRNSSVKGIYDADKVLKGCFAYKYQGTLPDGLSIRELVDDYPVYRYADLLLMLAEAKATLEESPATEIDLIRERAYGETYFNANKSTLAYPNFSGDNDINEALLKERYKEFLFEGKRWYDLRRFGNEYIFKYTTANSAYPKHVYWPIDTDTKTDNPALVDNNY